MQAKTVVMAASELYAGRFCSIYSPFLLSKQLSSIRNLPRLTQRKHYRECSYSTQPYSSLARPANQSEVSGGLFDGGGDVKLSSLKRSFATNATKGGIGGEIGESPFLEQLPPPQFSKINTSVFVKSSVGVKDCPPGTLPEIAVIGRSNAGKSTLINFLTGKRNLAMVSNSPGKTKLINHFLINDKWYLVDLPGYGYARVGKGTIVDWHKATQEYFLNRDSLLHVLLLVDASIRPQKMDLDCANWLGDSEVPFSIIFTKTDKKKKGLPTAMENMEGFQRLLLENWECLPACFATSAKAATGRQELLSYMARLRLFFSMNKEEGLNEV